MKTRVIVIVVTLVMAMVAVSWAQDNKASVEMGKSGSFKPGDPIVFRVIFNTPLPKEANLTFQISASGPVVQNYQLPSVEAIDASRKTFRISGKLPEDVLPGKWYISRCNVNLPDIGWSSIQVVPSDLSFEIKGKPYPKIPTEANVTIEH